MHIVANGSEVGEKIGSPTQLTDANINDTSASTSSMSNGSTSKPVTNGTTNGSANVTLGTLNVTHVHPISSLSPYHNK